MNGMVTGEPSGCFVDRVKIRVLLAGTAAVPMATLNLNVVSLPGVTDGVKSAGDSTSGSLPDIDNIETPVNPVPVMLPVIVPCAVQVLVASTLTVGSELTV
jgi:hypothetical protein